MDPGARGPAGTDPSSCFNLVLEGVQKIQAPFPAMRPHPTNATLVPLLHRLATLAALVALGLLAPQNASAGLILRIDTGSKTFFMEGSDTGNAYYPPPDPSNPFFGPSSYSLQFIHYFSTPVPQSSVVTSSPQNLFAEGASLFGQMNMISNYGQEYVFIDLSSGSSDITTLTGNGPSAAVSYAGLATANIPLFESLIGDTLGLSIGTGYGSISVQGVQAVPENNPAGVGSILVLVTGALGLLGRRLKAKLV